MKSLYLLLCIALVGCEQSAQSAAEEAAYAAKMAKRDEMSTTVFSKYEDCTIYRSGSYNAGYVLWTRCKKEPKVVNTEITEYCGKGCTRKVITTTIDEEVK